MNDISRRKLIATGIAATRSRRSCRRRRASPSATASSRPIPAAYMAPARLSPTPAQRVLTRRSLAREFPRSIISENPFANENAPPSDEFKRLQADDFAGWHLIGRRSRRSSPILLPRRPKSAARRSQITEVACEEGWSYIAEWIGRRSRTCSTLSASTAARYLVYFSIQPDWWESIDMAEATHPRLSSPGA